MITALPPTASPSLQHDAMSKLPVKIEFLEHGGKRGGAPGNLVQKLAEMKSSAVVERAVIDEAIKALSPELRLSLVRQASQLPRVQSFAERRANNNRGGRSAALLEVVSGEGGQSNHPSASLIPISHLRKLRR